MPVDLCLLCCKPCERFKNIRYRTYRQANDNQITRYNTNKNGDAFHINEAEQKNEKGLIKDPGGQVLDTSPHSTPHTLMPQKRADSSPTNQQLPFTDLAVNGPTVPGR